MPKIKLRLAALVRTLASDLLLAEALLFPGASCLNGKPARLRKMLTGRVRDLLKRMSPGEIYRHRLGELPALREITVDVPPLRSDVARREDVKLTLHYVQWRHNNDGVIASVPALGMEVLAESERQLAAQLEPQIKSALARRGSASSLRDLVWLESVRNLQVKPLRLAVKLPTLKQAAQEQGEERSEQKSLLKDVVTDLRKQLQRPVYQREKIVAQLAGWLTGRSPRSVLLVGPSGAGKTALVRELVRRREDFTLPATPIWSTSGARLVAGMSGFGMWQERCHKLIEAADKAKAIVHLDNLVELIETGKGGGNTQGIASVLCPAIERGALLAIAECTPEQLAIVEREDPQLLDAFAQVEVPEPSPDEVRSILACVAGERASDRIAGISAAALAEVDRLHRRYATYSAAPGRPLRFLTNLLEDQPSDRQIAPADVIAAFSHETGLPRFMLDDEIPFSVASTRDWLAQRVMGQAEPVELLADLLAAIKAGLTRGGKPIASFLFIGPTGVGKTEMAKALAEFLYQDPGRMIRFDMTEYSHPGDVERLIGGTCSATGLLTQKVRDQPFMVVLLDEFEKAHPALFDVLLQVLGEGRLTDAAGRVADFTNTVVIMTSNLGAESFRRATFGFSGSGTSGPAGETASQRHFEGAVRAFLRPEMFNRIDRIVSFAALDKSTIDQIASRELQRVSQRDGLRNRDVALQIAPDAVEHLAAGGYDPRYGARPLKRAIERRLVAPLADRLCRLPVEQAAALRCRMEGAELAIDVALAAGRKAAGAGPAALHELNQVVGLRRRVQALEQCGAILRLRNEIIRLKQAERQRRKRLRMRREPERYQFSRQQIQILEQEKIVERVDRLARDMAQLEDAVLGEHYAGKAIDAPLTAELRGALDVELREILYELHKEQGYKEGLSLVIFSQQRDRVLDLAAAYDHVCVVNQANVRRHWFKPHDPALEAALSKRPAEGQLVPNLRLLSRKRHAEDAPHKVVDVWRPADSDFYSPPSGVIGVSLSIEGERAAALLETEGGRHEFPQATGKGDACFVETHRGLLINYNPPHDVGRSGSFADLAVRRRYDLPGKLCHDVLLQASLEMEDRSLNAVVAKAVADYLVKRIWSVLD